MGCKGGSWDFELPARCVHVLISLPFASLVQHQKGKVAPLLRACRERKLSGPFLKNIYYYYYHFSGQKHSVKIAPTHPALCQDDRATPGGERQAPGETEARSRSRSHPPRTTAPSSPACSSLSASALREGEGALSSILVPPAGHRKPWQSGEVATRPWWAKRWLRAPAGLAAKLLRSAAPSPARLVRLLRTQAHASPASREQIGQGMEKSERKVLGPGAADGAGRGERSAAQPAAICAGRVR